MSSNLVADAELADQKLTAQQPDTAVALLDYVPDEVGSLVVSKGQTLTVLNMDNSEWWHVQDVDHYEGWVPSSHLRLDRVDGGGGDDDSSRASSLYGDAYGDHQEWSHHNEHEWRDDTRVRAMSQLDLAGKDVPLLLQNTGGSRPGDDGWGAYSVTGYIFFLVSLLRWTAFFALVTGSLQLLASYLVRTKQDAWNAQELQLGVYCLLLSVFIGLFELARVPSYRPKTLYIRSVIYAPLSVWPFISHSLLLGFLLNFVSICSFLAAYNGESGCPGVRQEGGEKRGCCAYLMEKVHQSKRKVLAATSNNQDKDTTLWTRLARGFILLCYVGLNVYLFVDSIIFNSNLKQHDNYDGNYVMGSADLAGRAFGVLININIFTMLGLIVPTIHRKIHNKANTEGSSVLKGISSVIIAVFPPHHRLFYHINLFAILLAVSMGHAFCFLLLVRTDRVVPGSDEMDIWLGSTMMFLMVTISVGSQKIVRKFYHQLFYAAHGCYLLFAVLYAVHITPARLYVFLIRISPALVLQLIDFGIRYNVRRRRVNVQNVSFLAGGMTIQVSKQAFQSNQRFSHKAGQYFLVSVPGVSALRWRRAHVASAPFQPNSLTLYIPVHQTTTQSTEENPLTYEEIRTLSFLNSIEWSRKVRSYLQSLAPLCDEFDLQNGHETTNPTAKYKIPILRMDGPYATPFQHFADSVSTIAVAVGEQSYSLLSTLQEILLGRWLKERNSRVTPRNVRFYFLFSWEKIDRYIWLFSELVRIQSILLKLEEQHSDLLADKSYEIGIFVTKVPSRIRRAAEGRGEMEQKYALASAPSFWGPQPTEYDKELTASLFAKYVEKHDNQNASSYDDLNTSRRSNLGSLSNMNRDITRLDLYRAVKYPQNTSQKIGGIRVWLGYPKWHGYIHSFQLSHPVHKILVLYGGPKKQGKDLEEICEDRSSFQQKITFLGSNDTV